MDLCCGWPMKLLWPEGEPYSNERVRSLVRPSVRPPVRPSQIICFGSSLYSLLLQNYSTDFSNADTNLTREQCRFATYTSF